MKLHPVWKNKIPYLESLKIQEELKAICLKKKIDLSLGFECPSTITLGLRGEKEDLLLSEDECKKKNISIMTIKRGGQATLHSPGQLIIYPIVDIKRNKMRVRDFIEVIEKITHRVFSYLGVKTHKEEDQAGLFTDKGKIAFFGIHVSEGISQHGLAMNINNDLNLFSYIRSCGIKNRPHDRLCHYHSKITMREIFDLWIKTAENI